MPCYHRKSTPKPNAHKKAEPSQAGNGKKSYDDKHGMERHNVEHKLEADGPARVVSTGK